MADDRVDHKRRRFLTGVTSGIGFVGGVVAAIPFVASMSPSARARAAGAPVEADFSKLKPGQMMTVEWRGNPVWIVNRTPSMLADLAGLESKLADAKSDVEDQQPGYAQNSTRSIRPEILVLVGICTHLGCSPSEKFQVGPDSGIETDWKGGFYCPCHGSKFDLAGRVYKGVPAPTNLEVPPHSFLSDTLILIGVDPEQEGAA